MASDHVPTGTKFSFSFLIKTRVDQLSKQAAGIRSACGGLAIQQSKLNFAKVDLERVSRCGKQAEMLPLEHLGDR